MIIWQQIEDPQRFRLVRIGAHSDKHPTTVAAIATGLEIADNGSRIEYDTAIKIK